MWNKRRLPRLPAPHYQGRAYVFWTHVTADRKTGWLNHTFHSHFREILLHTLARFRIGCPVYVLMPDHIHLIWIGAHITSDQLLANRFFRTHLQLPLQKQAYDHVIREEERAHAIFADTIHYIRQNPVRAELADTANEWPYIGTMIPGYPNITPASLDAYWKCFHAYQSSLSY